jgi:protein-S-isoprenylcysteine O-methyltransferase Ste14
MSRGTIVLYFLAYATMYALPHIFFRRESLRRFNLMWWITAAPYTLAPIMLILTAAGRVKSLAAGSSIEPWLDGISVPFAAGSIALQLATMAVHRIPLALWHQKDDAPKEIVTWGPYGRVRHPFYVAFLLLIVGHAIAFPHWAMFASVIVAFAILTATAAREERRLLSSHLGSQYAAYLKRTGRFFPRFGATAS